MGRTATATPEEEMVSEFLMEAQANIEHATGIIRDGRLPNMDKTELIGDIRGVRNSIVGINSAGLNIYREFRKAA